MGWGREEAYRSQNMAVQPNQHIQEAVG